MAWRRPAEATKRRLIGNACIPAWVKTRHCGVRVKLLALALIADTDRSNWCVRFVRHCRPFGPRAKFISATFAQRKCHPEALRDDGRHVGRFCCRTLRGDAPGLDDTAQEDWPRLLH